jgi:hypothetical protein
MPVTLPTYDSDKVSSLSLTPTQVGNVTGGSWVEGSLPVTLSILSEIGISFDFSVNNDSERGLALAPRLPFTSATDDLAGTGETATTWTLTLSTDLVAPSASHNLYMVRSPATWSGSSNNPNTNRTNSGNESILVEDLTTTSSTWVLNGSTYDMVWNFNFLTTGYLGSADSAVISGRPMFDMVNSPTWNGLFQFHLDLSLPDAITTVISAATFAGNTHAWHTGAVGMPLDRRARVVHDYVTGQTYLSDEAVPDGFRDGIMVHPDNFDPDDPRDTHPFTPPPGEGVVDDEVTDVDN